MTIITIMPTLQTLVRTMTYGQCADCVQETSNQHHSTFLRHRTRVTAAPLGPVTLQQLYFPTRIPAELRRLTSSVVGSSLSSSCRISQIKIGRYLAFSLSDAITRIIFDIGILSLCSTVINSLHSFHLALKILQIKCELKDNIVVIKCFRILFMGN